MEMVYELFMDFIYCSQLSEHLSPDTSMLLKYWGICCVLLNEAIRHQSWRAIEFIDLRSTFEFIQFIKFY